jgi:DNA-binding beta-propeller fold protein YncE
VKIFPILAALILASTFSLRAELFVSGYNSHRVYRYNETNGAFMDVFVPNTNSLLNLPHGLAFGPDGNLYVASAGNDCILRYNGTNGAFLEAFASNNQSHQ